MPHSKIRLLVHINSAGSKWNRTWFQIRSLPPSADRTTSEITGRCDIQCSPRYSLRFCRTEQPNETLPPSLMTTDYKPTVNMYKQTTTAMPIAIRCHPGEIQVTHTDGSGQALIDVLPLWYLREFWPWIPVNWRILPSSVQHRLGLGVF